MSPQLDVASTLAQWQAQYHGRRLSADFTDNATFRISIICISAVVGFCVVALCLGCFCILRTKQRLAEKRREELVAGPIPKGLYMRAEDEPENQGAMSMGPRPPWDDGVDPPGLVLAEQVPHSHANAVHASRSAGGPHRTRLLLLSSRVADVGVVAGAALPCIVVVSYCWKGTTLQELMSLVKKAVGSTKLISIGVIAPASRPGSVGLLDGLRTTDNTLEDDAALRTFWARLGEMVDAGGRGAAGAAGTAGAAGAAAGAAAASVGPLQQQQQLHDRGIHLLGCRTTEDLDLGACMVSALQDAAKGPKVYASDDLMSGYRLAQLGDALTESSAAGRPFSSDWAMAVGAKGAPFLVLTETEAAGIYFDVARLPGVMDAARAAAQVAPPTRAAASASGSASSTACGCRDDGAWRRSGRAWGSSSNSSSSSRNRDSSSHGAG
ncbi:hypothetical protein FOA52_004417 [Chlamydomonas sp. UWO 241]|nr:hypothetical protein FOA52_004417 [Chlamydomonas sp. UWO 241]